MPMPYKHTNNLSELQNIGIVDGFDYTNDDPYGVAEAYFQFCQQNLSEECTQYDIQPARIYIRNVWTVNGYANRLPNNYSIIGVNVGTLTTLFRFFTDNRSIFDNKELVAFASLNQHEVLDYIAFQFTVQFTYYHELAHLIQKSPLISNQSLDEFYPRRIREGDGYSLLHHLVEFDADLFGSGNGAFHILDYWKKLPEELRTHESLQLLIALSSGAIFSYFLFLMEKYETIYYKASTHPHPMVRISYIVDNFIRTIQKNLGELIELDAVSTLRMGMMLADGWFIQNSKEGALSEFAKWFQNEAKNIEGYVNEVLIAESKKVDYLVMNRYQ
jgi:hypothetical protein